MSRRLLFSLLAAGSLLVAACGGADGDDATGTSAEGATSAAGATCAAGKTLKDGTLTVATGAIRQFTSIGAGTART